MHHKFSLLWLCVRLRLPEQTHDDGAGEQRDERQAVTQSGQNLHHFVEDQLDTNTEKWLMEHWTRNNETISQIWKSHNVKPSWAAFHKAHYVSQLQVKVDYKIHTVATASVQTLAQLDHFWLTVIDPDVYKRWSVGM